MIVWGVLCLVDAFVVMYFVVGAGFEIGFAAVLVFMVAGSILIARGMAKKKAEQQKKMPPQAFIVAPQTVMQPVRYTPIPQSPPRQQPVPEQPPAPTSPPAPTPAPVFRTSVGVSYDDDGFPVAGVTYKNDDGSSRQQILEDLCEGKKSNLVSAQLEKYEYDGNPAVRVLTELGCVGNIRRQYVEDVLEALEAEGSDISLQISYFFNEEGKKIYRGVVFIDA